MKAPFTPQQVEALNRFQKRGDMHPFTCPGSVKDELSGAGLVCEDRDLIATEAGWVCACGRYTQDWAHDFMAEAKGD